MKTLNISRILLTSIMLAVIALPLSAQNSLQKAKTLQAAYAYSEAASLYQKHFVTRTPSLEEARDVAFCYIMTSDTRNASEWYGRVVNYDNRTAKDVLIYAQLLKTEGRYEDAILQFQHAQALDPASAAQADQEIASCNASLQWIADPVYFEVQNATMYNSENSEFGLMRFEDQMLIASDRRDAGNVYSESDLYSWTGNPYVKLYKVSASDHPTFRMVDGLNNGFHNGPSVYDKTSSVIFFTRTKTVKLKREAVNPDPTSWSKPSQGEQFVNRLELYMAHYSAGQWDVITPFAYNKAEDYSVGHAALSPDGNVLYFVSDMPGGYGDADIYYCVKSADGSWGLPLNAGADINTSGKEVFPMIAADGTLYFSSDGHSGMGGLDLFSAKGSLDNWNFIENMKVPFNSPKDDFSITWNTDGEGGYLASNRDGGMGADDLYSFVSAPPSRLVMVIKTLERLENGDIIPMNEALIRIEEVQGTLLKENSVDANGLLYSEANCNTEYFIEGQREGYYATSTALGTPACLTRNDTVYAELVFDKLVINKPIVLENIYYDFDKWFIRPDAAVELEKLVKILVDNPTISIELGSHTDSRGTNVYNETLSQKRAEAAVEYIISRGIAASRITAKGYGENVPVNECVDGSNCSDEMFQMNRRTEFKILKIN